MLKGILLSFLMLSAAHAEVPFITGNVGTDENFSRVSGKLKKLDKDITKLSHATVSTSTVVDLAHGGTNATTAASARTNLGVPSLTGTNASGLWNIGITGNAATATSANTSLLSNAVLSGGVDFSTVTAYTDTKVAKAGDSMTGPLEIYTSGNAYSYLTIGSYGTRYPYLELDSPYTGVNWFLGTRPDAGISIDNDTNDELFVMDSAGTRLENSSFTIVNATVAVTNNGVDVWRVTETGEMYAASTITVAAVDNPNYIKFNTSFTESGAHIEGRLHWDANDGTLNVDMAGGDINLQVGQEMLFKAKMLGIDGLNGQVVAITGAAGERPTIELADADNVNLNKDTIGVLTHNIAQNNSGFFNAFGYVRDIDLTAFAEGDILYLSTTPGTLTNVIPAPPARVVKIGRAIKVTGATGGILFVDVLDVPDQVVVSSVTASEYYGNINGTNGLNVTHRAMYDEIKDPTGFPAVDGSSIVLVGRACSIFANSTNYSFYANGVKLVKTTDTVTVPDVTQLNWVYFTTAGVLSQSTSFPGFEYPLVATVYYSTTQASGILANERHGAITDWRTHEYLHETIGSRYASGLSASFYASSMVVTSGEFYDDDLEHDVSEQRSFIALYKENGNPWYEFVASTTAYVVQKAGVIQYNSGDTLVPVTNNRYVAYWVFVTPNVNRAVQIIAGQREDVTLSNARLNNTIDSLVLTGLPDAEQKLLYRIIVQRNGSSYTYIENADYRSVTNLPSGNFVPTSHASLTNLSLTTAGHPYDQVGGYASYDTLATTGSAVTALSIRVNNLDTYTLSTGTVFGGDVTGTYGATAVGNDSHAHTGVTITNFIGSTNTIPGSNVDFSTITTALANINFTTFDDIHSAIGLTTNGKFYKLYISDDGYLVVDETLIGALNDSILQTKDTYLYKWYMDTQGVLMYSKTTRVQDIVPLVLKTTSDILYNLVIDQDGYYNLSILGAL